MPQRRRITIPPWGQFALIATGVVGGGILVGKQVKRYREKKKIKDFEKIFQQSKVPILITDETGKQVAIRVNTATAAVTIYDAIHNNDWFGVTEDERTIVDTLRAIPKAYIPQLIQNYADLYTKNLMEEVKKALGAGEWKQVDYLFQ